MGKQRRYIIKNKADSSLYWSNVWGWGDRTGATTFSQAEKATRPLPMEGFWVFKGWR